MADHVFSHDRSFNIDDGLVCSAIFEIGGIAACPIRGCLGGAAILGRDIFLLCPQNRIICRQKKNIDFVDNINSTRILPVKYLTIVLGDNIYSYIIFCQGHKLSGVERLYKSNHHIGYKGNCAVGNESGSKVIFFGLWTYHRLDSRSVFIKHGIDALRDNFLVLGRNFTITITQAQSVGADSRQRNRPGVIV